MIYDVHTHILEGRYEETKEKMLRISDRYGIDKIFVSCLTEIPNPNEAQVDEVNSECYKFKREHPELVESYVYISPELPNAMDTLRKGIEDNSAVGVKLWMSTTCDDARVNPIVEKMIEYKAPILIHAFHKAVGQLAFETTGEHVARLAKRYPESKLIMAHLGGNAYHSVPPIAECENVWVDMCSSIFRGDELTYTLQMVGEDRVLYGSDAPDVPPLVNLGQVEELNVSQQVKEKIYYLNTQKLFGEVLK